MNSLVQKIISNNEILTNAQRKAGNFVHNDPKNLKVCCAATLSFLLIDNLNLSMSPQDRALKLAYILKEELGYRVIETDQDIKVGDVGVVNQPKGRAVFSAEMDDYFGDGDVQIIRNIQLPTEKYTGKGYEEPDPDDKNWHHIYLVVSSICTPNNENLLLVADNQGPTPHLRDKTGGHWSKTNYFLRAPS